MIPAQEAGRPVIPDSIEATPGICGGPARVAGTRVPVWAPVEARDLGATDDQLLLDYPDLRAEDLADAWAYASGHEAEIAAEIRRDEVG